MSNSAHFLAATLLAAIPLHAHAAGQAQASPPAQAATEDTSALPPPVRRMMEEALAGGDAGEIATVAKYAIAANPDAATEIEAMVAQHQALAQAAREERLSQADILALWKGKIELGGFATTGSSDEVGISVNLAATREGLRWVHDFTAMADHRRANGETSAERILASYGPRYRFDQRNFAYGLIQYERDLAVGYDHRYTGSLGIGYSFVANERISLAATLGPSVRRTRYTGDGTETEWGGRSSLDFKWMLSPALTLRQTASAYGEPDTVSVSSLTALDTRLISKLSARLSYNMRYESGSRLTEKAFDTTSKVTLIYDF